MTLPVFIVDDLTAQLATGAPVTLDGAEGHHAARVRRVRPGERVVLVDGAGTWAEAVVRELSGERVVLAAGAPTTEPERAPRLVLVQALPKGERAELAVELATEGGADEVVPWSAARCVTRWSGERGERARRRWTAVAREAGKQARRPRLPLVAPLASTDDLVVRLRGAALAVVLHESAERSLAGVVVPVEGEVVVVVGPEGGITADELAALRSAGALVCRLGPSVLRTSSAGLAALAVLAVASGRWS